MNQIQQLITNYIHIWASSKKEKKSNRGRSNGSKNQVYGMQKLRDLILDLGINGNLIKVNKSDFRTITLGALGQWGSGGTPLKSNLEFYDGNIPWLVIGDLNDGLITKSESHITDLGLKNSSAKLIPKGSLLIAMYGSIGKLGITGIECTTNQAIAFCIPDNKIILTKYLFFYLRSIRNKLLDRGQGLAQQNISQTILKQFKVQIPSLVKQEQIISKIDELMPLCEQLEEQYINSEESHEKLVKVLLDTLTQSKDADEFENSWQRITNHFNTLFTTEESIDDLKQTLLQLAVTGKIVPQDSNDEPTVELISNKKEQLNLPLGWRESKLKDISTHIGDGLHGTPIYKDSGKYYFINGNNLKEGKIVIKYETKKVDFEQYSKYRKVLTTNTILISINGTLGSNAFYAEEPVVLGKSACYINLLSNKVNKHFIKLIIDSPIFMKYALENATGATIKNLGLKAINSMPIALPPLAEQCRIVSKVNELMTLCDELKSLIQHASAKQKLIADVLVLQALH
jgi:type I restriction enzyme S subunit